MSQRFANTGLRTLFARKKSVIAILGLAASVPAWALTDFNDSSTGVSCQYWDKATSAGWKNAGGDWIDASGAAQGSTAFSTVTISDSDATKAVSWNVTNMVKNWGNASVYRGIMVRNVGGANSAVFSSRQGSVAPKLIVKYADGSTATLSPQADSQLQCPWVTPIGTAASMTLDKAQNIVLRFDAQRRTDVVSATLTMTSTAQYGQTSVGVFQLAQPGATATTSTTTPTTTTPTTTTSPTTTTTSPTTTTTTPTTTTTSPTTTTTTPTTTTSSEPPAWYRLYDGSTGVTCSAWNSAAKLNWRNKGGDWLDANGSAQGTTAFAKATLSGSGTSASLDVTRIVQGWATPARYRGIMLRSESGTAYIASREASAAPVLSIRYNDGTTATVKPNADSHLDCSTVYGKGTTTSMTVNSSMKAALSFDVPRRADVASATLKVTSSSSSSATLGAYQLRQPETGAGVPVEQGIAANYPGDVGIENDPSVVMVERFESSNFYQGTKWGYSSLGSTWHGEVLGSDSTNGFQNLSGNAFRIRIPAGENFGMAIAAKTQKIMGTMPEELYFRYNLRFASIFRDTADGGKMPGMTSDLGGCGNGGRRCDGTSGWSLRGSFFNSSDPSNPVYPRILLGTYAYHADMPTTYGDHWPWQQNGLGMVEQNRWYSVEQYVKMNTPGSRNGIIKVWVDGKLAFQKTDLNLRTVSGWNIYQAWIDHYYGGTGTPSHNLALYMDNMVVAKKYIGPIKK